MALSRQTRTWVVVAQTGSERGVWDPFPVSVLGLRAEEGEELRSVTWAQGLLMDLCCPQGLGKS